MKSTDAQDVPGETGSAFNGLPDPRRQFGPVIEGLPSTASAVDYTDRRRSSGSGSLAQTTQDPATSIRIETSSTFSPGNGSQIGSPVISRADEWGYREPGSERPFGSMPQPSAHRSLEQPPQHFSTFSASQRDPPNTVPLPSSSRFSGNTGSIETPPLSASSQFSSFPARKSSLAGTGSNANQQLSPPPPPPHILHSNENSTNSTSSSATRPNFELLGVNSSSLAPSLGFSASFSEEIESALAQASVTQVPEARSNAKLNEPVPAYSPPAWESSMNSSPSGLPKGAAPPNAPHPHTPQLTSLKAGPQYFPEGQSSSSASRQQLQVPREEHQYDSDDDTQLAYARDSFEPGHSHTNSQPQVRFGGQSNVPDGVPEDVLSQDHVTSEGHVEGIVFLSNFVVCLY